MSTPTLPTLLPGEIYHKPIELAKRFRAHPTTIRKTFLNEEGVIKLGHPARGKRRQYFTLLIPESVVQRVFGKMTVGAAS